MKFTNVVIFLMVQIAASPYRNLVSAAERPNIVLIVADDLGWGELGCQGNNDVPTPFIDSLAGSGVRFTSAYVTCPVCSPTRAALMTGRYQQRFGHEYNPPAAALTGPEFGLPLSEITIADRLSSVGYTCGLVGKWHLGLHPQYHPLKRGFHEFFGFLHGAHSYVDPHAEAANPILRGTQSVDEKGYLTEAFSREGVDFIQRHAAQPFFLCLTYNAVHTPLQVPEKYLERVSHITNETRRTFAAMVACLDDGVGQILEQLRKSRVEENTLIIFISDNGGPTEVSTSDNGPLKGYKSTIYEGGIRVPFLIQWKGKLPEGKVDHRLTSTLDIFPTVVKAAGGSLQQDKRLDGVDLVPFVTGERTSPPHETLFWRYGDPRAIRRDRWKLILRTNAPLELYDLETDIGETTNLALSEPARTEELTTALKKWDSELATPLWPSPGPRRGKVLDLTNPKATRVYRPVLIAHRGGVVTPKSPECSQMAIRKAAEAGYHLVELDIRPTKDHFPVVFHDRGLSRATDATGQVDELTLEQVLTIHYRGLDERIATLDAAMQLCKSLGLGVMLDVKDASSELMLQRTADIVRKHGMENSTITLNGDPQIAGALSTVSLVHLRSRDQIPRHRLSTAERPLAGYFWFGLPKDLPEDRIAQWQNDGALVIPAINTFRYPADLHQELATRDIVHLRKLGVDGFQIDSVYQDRFGFTSPSP